MITRSKEKEYYLAEGKDINELWKYGFDEKENNIWVKEVARYGIKVIVMVNGNTTDRRIVEYCNNRELNYIKRHDLFNCDLRPDYLHNAIIDGVIVKKEIDLNNYRFVLVNNLILDRENTNYIIEGVKVYLPLEERKYNSSKNTVGTIKFVSNNLLDLINEGDLVKTIDNEYIEITKETEKEKLRIEKVYKEDKEGNLILSINLKK